MEDEILETPVEAPTEPVEEADPETAEENPVAVPTEEI